MENDPHLGDRGRTQKNTINKSPTTSSVLDFYIRTLTVHVRTYDLSGEKRYFSSSDLRGKVTSIQRNVKVSFVSLCTTPAMEMRWMIVCCRVEWDDSYPQRYNSEIRVVSFGRQLNSQLFLLPVPVSSTSVKDLAKTTPTTSNERHNSECRSVLGRAWERIAPSNNMLIKDDNDMYMYFLVYEQCSYCNWGYPHQMKWSHDRTVTNSGWWGNISDISISIYW